METIHVTIMPLWNQLINDICYITFHVFKVNTGLRNALNPDRWQPIVLTYVGII